mgnify:CR=1 FL=1
MAFGSPQDGHVVSLKYGQDRLLGSAIFNSKSQIIARRFSRQRQELDLEFFTRRIRLAAEYRARRGLDPRLGRVVWGAVWVVGNLWLQLGRVVPGLLSWGVGCERGGLRLVISGRRGGLGGRGELHGGLLHGGLGRRRVRRTLR